MMKVYFPQIISAKKYELLMVKAFCSLKKKRDYNIKFFTSMIKAQLVIFIFLTIKRLSQFKNIT